MFEIEQRKVGNKSHKRWPPTRVISPVTHIERPFMRVITNL